jgi:hypothetical protein
MQNFELVPATQSLVRATQSLVRATQLVVRANSNLCVQSNPLHGQPLTLQCNLTILPCNQPTCACKSIICTALLLYCTAVCSEIPQKITWSISLKSVKSTTLNPTNGATNSCDRPTILRGSRRMRCCQANTPSLPSLSTRS